MSYKNSTCHLQPVNMVFTSHKHGVFYKKAHFSLICESQVNAILYVF